MRASTKFLWCAAALVSASQLTHAAYVFPAFDIGAVSTAASRPWVGLDLSTVGVPTAATYKFAEIQLDWTGGGGTANTLAWSSEPRITFSSVSATGTGTSSTLAPTYPAGAVVYSGAAIATPANGASNADNVANLRFAVPLPTNYVATGSGPGLFLNYRQAFDGTNAVTLTNVRVTLLESVPLPPPPTHSALGELGDISATYATPDITRSNTGGAVRWYKITVPQGITNASGFFLDLDTEGTTGVTDTEIGVYRPDGTLLISDDDDGTGNLSQLSFGLTSPTRTIGSSTGGNGRDGALIAGDYYVAVGGFNMAFGASNFAVTTTSTNTTGNVVLNIRTNVVPIPEPTALAALAPVAMLLGRRRRA